MTANMKPAGGAGGEAMVAEQGESAYSFFQPRTASVSPALEKGLVTGALQSLVQLVRLVRLSLAHEGHRPIFGEHAVPEPLQGDRE